MDESYEIMDGVRRAKAALLAGHQTIRARLYGGGIMVQEFDVPISDLRSPHKNSIRRQSRSDRLRWQRAVEGAKQVALPYPPIEIVSGQRGATVDEITLD